MITVNTQYYILGKSSCRQQATDVILMPCICHDRESWRLLVPTASSLWIDRREERIKVWYADVDFSVLHCAHLDSRLGAFLFQGELIYLNRGTLDDYSDKASKGLKGKIGLVRTGQTTLEEKVWGDSWYFKINVICSMIMHLRCFSISLHDSY